MSTCRVVSHSIKRGVEISIGEQQMMRDDAVGMVQKYFESYGVVSSGLNKNNLGGAAIGDAEIYFEYEPSAETLKCSALIYKFQVEPKTGILEKFRDEELITDTAGGKVDYEPENRGLYLSRVYSERVETEQLREDLDQLIHASRVWGIEVLERVAAKTFHPEEVMFDMP